ncbi:MAG: hypothetical protein CO125_07245 [Hydrogenophilales bacterium CG_4_9_14_3_um_filter_59_35]|nr:MAG: hypothetical protein COZ23_05040 [Hydrogenophilales bacterium CG_4_10_14_3_um_filter_58_23]PJB06337.1 MAG: hypothetical protein CO125_07245 [Hydrogenophilales bacterium CG_4_9_14_3_um_filter_59_35]
MKDAYLFLEGAEKILDLKKGEGYAAAHPEIVAAYMQAAALNFQAQEHAAILQGIELSLDKLLGER